MAVFLVATRRRVFPSKLAFVDGGFSVQSFDTLCSFSGLKFFPRCEGKSTHGLWWDARILSHDTSGFTAYDKRLPLIILQVVIFLMWQVELPIYRIRHLIISIILQVVVVICYLVTGGKPYWHNKTIDNLYHSTSGSFYYEASVLYSREYCAGDVTQTSQSTLFAMGSTGTALTHLVSNMSAHTGPAHCYVLIPSSESPPPFTLHPAAAT